MDSGAGLIRLALFGAPVVHSQSPRIHSLFAQQAGIEASYEALETPPGTLADALEAFARHGGTGCNITLPLKSEALELALESSATARLAGAANTLTALPGGAWKADTTDGAGLVCDLQRHHDIAGKRLAIAGAGGAASGVLAALLGRSPASISLINRNRDKAMELAARHASLGDVGVLDWSDFEQEAAYDLLVNATSLGHEGKPPPFQPGQFGSCYDLNYGAAAAPLRDWCEQHGIPYQDGLGMLVEQAAESFRIWTGFRPDTQAVLKELRSV